MTTDEYIAQGRACADKNNAIDGIRQLRTAAANCQTKSDYVAFFRDKLNLQAVEADDGIILHLGKQQCTCPLFPKIQTPMLCRCTQAHEEYVWSEFFGEPVQVEIVESFQRGGKDCVIMIKL